MLEAMFVFGALGLLLFFGGPWIAQWIRRETPDPLGIGRVLQLAGMLLLVAAVLFRPHDPATVAFPPPPDHPAVRPSPLISRTGG